jgi:DNA repair exonuclease SbcCD ATPase subunit
MDAGISGTLPNLSAVETAPQVPAPTNEQMPSGPWRIGRRHASRSSNKTNLGETTSTSTLASVALAELEVDNLRLELEERDEWLSRLQKHLEESQKELESSRAEALRLRQVVAEQNGRLVEFELKQQTLTDQIQRLQLQSVAQSVVDSCVSAAVFKVHSDNAAASSVPAATTASCERLQVTLLRAQRDAREIHDLLRMLARSQKSLIETWRENLPRLAQALPQLADLVPAVVLQQLEEQQRKAIEAEYAELDKRLRAREGALRERESRVEDLEARKESVLQREKELEAWEALLRDMQRTLEEQRVRMERLMQGMVPVELVEARERSLRHRETSVEMYERSIERSLQARKASLLAEQAELESRLHDEWARFHLQCEAERHDLQRELDQERMLFRERIEAQHFELQSRFEEFSMAAEAEAVSFSNLLRDTVSRFAMEVSAAKQLIAELDSRFQRILENAERQADLYRQVLRS